MTTMLERAEAADDYRKRFARAHPDWGNGSLMALAMREVLPPEPSYDDPDYCRCLATVLCALANWRGEKAALGGRRQSIRTG